MKMDENDAMDTSSNGYAEIFKFTKKRKVFEKIRDIMFRMILLKPLPLSASELQANATDEKYQKFVTMAERGERYELPTIEEMDNLDRYRSEYHTLFHTSPEPEDYCARARLLGDEIIATQPMIMEQFRLISNAVSCHNLATAMRGLCKDNHDIDGMLAWSGIITSLETLGVKEILATLGQMKMEEQTKVKQGANARKKSAADAVIAQVTSQRAAELAKTYSTAARQAVAEASEQAQSLSPELRSKVLAQGKVFMNEDQFNFFLNNAWKSRKRGGSNKHGHGLFLVKGEKNEYRLACKYCNVPVAPKFGQHLASEKHYAKYKEIAQGEKREQQRAKVVQLGALGKTTGRQFKDEEHFKEFLNIPWKSNDREGPNKYHHGLYLMQDANGDYRMACKLCNKMVADKFGQHLASDKHYAAFLERKKKDEENSHTAELLDSVARGKVQGRLFRNADHFKEFLNTPWKSRKCGGPNKHYHGLCLVKDTKGDYRMACALCNTSVATKFGQHLASAKHYAAFLEKKKEAEEDKLAEDICRIAENSELEPAQV